MGFFLWGVGAFLVVQTAVVASFCGLASPQSTIAVVKKVAKKCKKKVVSNGCTLFSFLLLSKHVQVAVVCLRLALGTSPKDLWLLEFCRFMVFRHLLSKVPYLGASAYMAQVPH